ncbi:RNA polymerase sigma factor [Lentzea sp. NPDC051838]|uniref:RNA polymerase sigma factor n=1 Tax=Lentzea sp. NPDC051838 TaxID=3154849 RepID=UPI00341CE30D
MNALGEDADDATVIEASLHDPERFAVIFDRHGPHISRYLERRMGRQAADDLVAETFLTALAKRGQYDLSRPDARPWLYGIATNLVSRHWRAEERELKLRGRALIAEPQAGHAERVAEQVTAQAMGKLLATALAELADAERDVLLLVAWEGLAYDEVAAALDIPVGTVRSRLNRARKKVRLTLRAADDIATWEEANHG